MTCIIGVEHEGTVYMGADSISMSGWAKDITAQQKLFTRAGMLFGCAGSPRMAQILRYQTLFAQPKNGQSDEEYLVCEVIEKARLAFKEYGYTETENGRELGASFLLGFRGKLYSVENSFQLCRSDRHVYAIGAGDDFAMGALCAILSQFETWTEIGIVEGIKHALKMAAELSAAVAPPFVLEKITQSDYEADQKAFMDQVSKLPSTILDVSAEAGTLHRFHGAGD